MKDKEIIRLEIAAYTNREKMVLALTESGFKVWIEQKQAQMGFDYFVCFERT